MNVWSLLVPGFVSPLDGAATTGGWPGHLLFVVLFCTLVDFVKLLVELFSRIGLTAQRRAAPGGAYKRNVDTGFIKFGPQNVVLDIIQRHFTRHDNKVEFVPCAGDLADAVLWIHDGPDERGLDGVVAKNNFQR